MQSTRVPCLVIPDVHQHIRWAEAILEKEADSVVSVVFLGDYFDAKLPAAADARETALYFSALQERYACEFTFLVGNHDLPYLYDFQTRSRSSNPLENPYSCSGYDPNDSQTIQSSLSPSFVSSLQPFALRHGWLLSHAGVHRHYWESYRSEDSPDAEALLEILTSDLQNLGTRRSLTIAAVGSARGGFDKHGGIAWQDWYQEFEDSLPWPQIVGHTILQKPEQNGRSWNIDTRSGHYVLLSPEGVEIRSEPKQ